MLNQQLVQKVLERALSTGADFAEVFVEDKVNTGLSYVDGRLDRIGTGQDYGLGLRLIKGLEVLYAYTSDLSEDSLLKMAERTAQIFTEKQHASVIAFNPAPPLQINPIKIRPQDVALKEKVELLRKNYEIAKAYDPMIVQAAMNYLDETQKVLIANSEGLWVEDERIRSRFFASAIAMHEGEMQTGYMGPGSSKGFEFFQENDLEAITKEACRIAVTMAKANYAPSGKMPVIMDNSFGGVLFHEACGHGLEAAFVSKGESVYAGMLGKQIASPLVTAIDDGTIAGEWGSSTYDDEGTPTQRNLLIENGILKSYLVDRYTGKRSGMKTTGSSRRQSYRYAPTSRMNNTFIAAGESTRDEIITNTEYGLYAKNLGGGSVDVTTGEFNFAVLEGYLIKDGKITEPVRGASLIGSGKEVLEKIDMVGREFELGQGVCGASSGSIPASLGQPPLRISELTVGGR